MDAPQESLQKLLLAGIVTVHDLVDSGTGPVDRKNLAIRSGLDQAQLYTLVKQADLLRVDGLESPQASLLIKAGIRGILDLTASNPVKLQQRLVQLNQATPETPLPTVNDLERWKKIAATLKPLIAPDAGDQQQPGLLEAGQAASGNPRDEIFADMVEMVINLGRGISQAQQEMDEQAIRTQKLINADPRLRNMGIMATWFAIPEATFNLKMNYSLVREQGAEHDAPSGRQRFLVTPLNARTQNYFKLNEGMQSELNIRFASLPPPAQVSQPVIVPSVIGKTLEEARALLGAVSLRAGTVSTVSGTPGGGNETEVTGQIPEPGSDARFQDRINLLIRREGQPA